MNKLNPEFFSSKRMELFEGMLKKKGITPSKNVKITKRRCDNRCRLSFSQQRLWFLDQFEEGGSAYNLPAAIRCKGTLDVVVLKKCFNDVIKRHEILRTRFESEEGLPIQIIEPAVEIEIPVLDMSGLEEPLVNNEVVQLAKKDAGKRFRLSETPLIRVTLVKIREDEYVLLLCMHHIISDGWSMGVLVKEISVLYESYLNGSAPLLPLPEIQYADYAEWQRDYLKGEILEKEMEFWRILLKGVPTVIDLPTDRPRPPVQTSSGALKFFSLPEEIVKSIKLLSLKENITTYMMYLTAFAVLLYRYTNQEDFLVGSPVAGRDMMETENLIGFFVNTLVMRTNLSGDPGFLELLSRIRAMVLEAYSHQNIPFEKLVEEFQNYRDMSHSPLFQVMFMIQNTAMPRLKLTGLELELMELESDSSQFDLSLSIKEDGEKIYGSFEYNTDLFDENTINGIITHFQELLCSIISEPDQKISRIPILSMQERKKITGQWNNTREDYPEDKCIYQLFKEQSTHMPDDTAVIFDTQCLSYRELHYRVDKMASYLHTMQVIAGQFVGIYMDCCLEMITAILGVLKAGGVYVPLDPGYPQERIDYMIKDSGISIILTCERYLEDISGKGRRILCLDSEWESIKDTGSENHTVTYVPESPACVIYTSGSTGEPKGVLLENRGIVNLIVSFNRSYKVKSGDRVLPLTSIASASFAGELFPILCAGGTLVLINKDELLDMEKLFLCISKYNVSIISTIPSLIARLNSNADMLPDLRLILSGGEALTKGEIKNLLEKTKVVNGYGLTETTICSTYFIINELMDDSTQSIPVGKPIMNHYIYILDNNREPVPAGCPGEIYIGGAGLAKGYLNDPGMTGERFLDDPFLPGQKLFKTGDIGKWLPDGNLLYIGRCDQQVKIRGFRIETGEIESRISTYPGIEDCAVVLRKDASGNNELAAYLVTSEEKKISIGTLKEWLREKLPDYMIPALFEVMKTLPLTPNGKVDVDALPVPLRKRESDSIYEAPQGDLERMISEVWQDYLKVESVSINDNFFDIGGHSLLLSQVYSKLKGKIEKSLTIIDLFKYPTIKSLAEYLHRQETYRNKNQSVKERAMKQRRAFNRQKQTFGKR